MQDALDSTLLQNCLRRFGFEGKTALVVGGAGAIGSAVALAFGEHGADVAVVDMDSQRVEAVAEGVRRLGQRSCAIFGDIRRNDQMAEAVESTIQAFGRIDVLINTSGYSVLKPLLEMTQEDFEANLTVYLTGAFMASQIAARQMIRQATGGSIVHVSSISSVRALGRGTGAYAAAKAGLNALIREMAVEWARYGIRVNAVAPCQVNTPSLNHVLDSGLHGGRKALTDRMIASIPLGRFGEPEDIAGPCLFLASEAASMVTGQVLFVDGGNTAQ